MAMAVDEISAQLVNDERIIADCNKFVQAVAGKVATEYGIKYADFSKLFMGTANDIRLRFDRAPFISIGTDRARATKLANEGQLVFGGLSLHEMQLYEPKASMGHIVVIAPGGPSKPIPKSPKFHGAHGGYPYCYQGAHDPRYRFKNKTQVDAVFPRSSLPHIQYAYIQIEENGQTQGH